MSVMDEHEVFSRRYDGVEPAQLWPAVKRALATMDLREVDDEQRSARFKTGVSLTSWGQNMLASVRDDEGAATLVVRGRPKGSLLTTRIGEDLHEQGVEKQVVDAIDAALAPG